MLTNSMIPAPARQDAVGPIDYFGTNGESTFSSGDLVTERQLRAELDPEVVERIIDLQRHYHAEDGSRYWFRNDIEELCGLITAGKGVAR